MKILDYKMFKGLIVFIVVLLLVSAAINLYAVNPGQIHRGALTADGSLYFKAEPLSDCITDNQKNSDFFYYIHLEGIKAKPQSESRVPMNISLVIDRSGSMSGGSLTDALKAVRHVIKSLEPDDIVSIVTYDDNVNTVLEPKMVGKIKNVDRLTKAIFPGGSTNMEGGIKRGFELVEQAKKKYKNETRIHRVMLLSDGLANVGVSDPVALGQLTKNKFNKTGIGISTFGLGPNYNEELMSEIALKGGGQYYFIKSSADLSKIFDTELKGISNIVASNTKLQISYPTEWLTYDKIYSYDAIQKGNILEINLGDVFSENQKSILIQFKLKKPLDNQFDMQANLEYINASDEDQAIADSRSSTLVNPIVSQSDCKPNKAANEGYTLQKANELYQDATKLGNDRKFDESKKKIDQAQETLNAHFNQFGKHPFLIEIYNNFDEYKKQIKDMKKMNKKTFSLHLKKSRFRAYKSVSCPSF